MRICFFTKYQIHWGSSRERVGGYLEYLKEKGHTWHIISCIPEKLSRNWIGSGGKYPLADTISYFWYGRVLKHLKLIWLIIIAGRFDVILVQKLNLSYWLVFLLRRRNNNVIFDFDDQCFWDLNSLGEKRISLRTRIDLWRQGIQHPAVLRLYKKVIAGNDYLFDIASSARGSNGVTVIPTPVNCSIYFPKPKTPEPGRIVVGWAGSGENHLPHLELMAAVLKELKENCEFRFQLVGAMHSNKIRELFSFLDSWFVCVDWVSGSGALADVIRSFDIGVMPLVDDDKSKGKCGFKALQYMACGVPAVISPVGVNKDIVKDGSNGFLAASRREWVDKLSLLIRDPGLRAVFSKKGRETVEKKYSHGFLFPKWLDCLVVK